MILQNITRAIRTQNWFAVALEFLIVILGVVIGFQISAWNEARRDREAEQLILARLVNDFELIIAIEEENVGLVEDASRAGQAFLTQVANGSTTGEISEICAGMGPARRFRPPPAASPTYVQLVSNGDMGLIGAERLRAALANFETTRQRHSVGYQTSLDTVLSLSREFWMVVDVCDAAILGGNTAFADNVRTRIGQPEFAGALSGIVTQHINGVNQHSATLAEARSVLAILREEHPE